MLFIFTAFFEIEVKNFTFLWQAEDNLLIYRSEFLYFADQNFVSLINNM